MQFEMVEFLKAGELERVRGAIQRAAVHDQNAFRLFRR